jgi:hypothetical protein
MEELTVKVKLIEESDLKTYRFKSHTGQDWELVFPDRREGAKDNGMRLYLNVAIKKDVPEGIIDYRGFVTLGVDYLVFYPNGRVDVLHKNTYELLFKKP